MRSFLRVIRQWFRGSSCEYGFRFGPKVACAYTLVGTCNNPSKCPFEKEVYK